MMLNSAMTLPANGKPPQNGDLANKVIWGSTESVVNGGGENTINGNRSAILGGSGNTVNHNWAGVFGCNVTSQMDCAIHSNNVIVQNMYCATGGTGPFATGTLYYDTTTCIVYWNP
ncbi:MAG: hypothetical protein KF744_15750 [Taibaiella sp.]|nr:hypothetical protein [Taibaiella sp.]